MTHESRLNRDWQSVVDRLGGAETLKLGARETKADRVPRRGVTAASRERKRANPSARRRRIGSNARKRRVAIVCLRLKDDCGGRFVRLRGAIKVKCRLVFGTLASLPSIRYSPSKPSSRLRLFIAFAVGDVPKSVHKMLWNKHGT